MAKKSKYSVFAPIIKRRLKEEENKIGRKLSKDEKEIFFDSCKNKIRKGAAIGGTFAAVIVASVAGINTKNHAKLLEEPKQITQENTVSKVNDFKEKIKVNENELNKESKIENDILLEIIGEYTEKYNEALSKEKMGVMRSKPEFLNIDSEGNFVSDVRDENAEHISDNIGDMYIVTYKDKIIAALGKVENKYVNVDVKESQTLDEKKYEEADKKINLTEDLNGNKKSQEIIEKTYKELQEIVKNKRLGIEEEDREF